MSGLHDATRRRLSLIDTVRAIGAAFFGVRGSREHQRDIEQLNPVHVIVIGVALAALLVLGLLAIVNQVVG
jgi:hypothetical protein